MAYQSTPARRRGPRGDVSADALARAAHGVLSSKGLSGLSLRAVARAAGVTPNVLYTYFADMGQLRNRLGDEFLGRLELDLLRTDPPREALRHFLRHVLAVFASSPGHVQALAAQRVVGPHSLALNEALLEFFEDVVGHPPAIAADVTIFLTEWVHGRMMLQPSDVADNASRTALTGLDLTPYPRTVAMSPGTGEDAGIDLVVRITVPEPTTSAAG
ncbi:TetR/AcrR family transcriptional regulator [Ornithinimicrobium pratense]|uniref:TetR/AcrR family transcriptional regulator n=1 Tax=Ornithinimicrobium pratense TaxID=2593973 RepID=A0A5J6V5H8_9MICO|nr:TetR/AcrR family transcriptional regulator [Ornithinimicrobium pratense]QFG69035.1 TetR/AcrR family transcriptional regulator [Ornithinimicrobium pratense]